MGLYHSHKDTRPGTGINLHSQIPDKGNHGAKGPKTVLGQPKSGQASGGLSGDLQGGVL